MSDLTGQTLNNRYRIDAQLGEGGMAVVYKARDMRLEREVALKFIRGERLTSEKARKRFGREARALARLEHPNILAVYDYGEHDGHPYLVMPYVRGGTLTARLGKPMPGREAAQLLLPLAQALHYAHTQTQRIIHRDVKPANIL
ncbi:MAG: serine/threonine-protein kinase, partial [Anaerolineales bacterium]|nr:serine/threonine-protein kinase [Anaerolineales bacterium]